LSWLDDFTGEIPVGNDTYQYGFSQVEGNACKLEFEERHTDKKGNTEKSSWIFYLSDIDPDALTFRAKGKALKIYIETFRSQRFISYYEEGDLEEYTEELVLTMNDVDMARTFLSTIKEKIGECKETQLTWENRDQAFDWLENHVGKVTQGDAEWDQRFQQGNRSYLVDFQSHTVNKKGEKESHKYTFDLSDVNPQEIDLNISGTSLQVEVPVKEGKRFIQDESSDGTEFTNDLTIYADNIESSRLIVNALSYVVTHTTPERQQWDSYEAALEFVKENIGEVTIGDDHFSYNTEFEASPWGKVNLSVEESESDGTEENTTYDFYLADMEKEVELEVTRYGITVEMETKNGRDFIRESEDGKVTDYTSVIGFHVAEIDLARDLLNAWQCAIGKSEEKIEAFSSVGESGAWISENVGKIEIDGDTYDQTLTIQEDAENQLVLHTKITEEEGESTETTHTLYPEDISLDELEIQVSGKKLYVSLETEKGKYVKELADGVLQNFTSRTEIRFLDPLVAKSFMAAIHFLVENSVVEERSMSKEEGMEFLSENISTIDSGGDQFEQKLEMEEEGGCQMSFIRVEKDSKGGSDEYRYEFSVSDMDAANSTFSVKGKQIIINLETTGNEKLIKPYENGEADDFEDNFVIYTDDILLAKKILAAFAALSEACK
jgi:hypothetical protein